MGLDYDSTVMLTCKLLHKLCLLNPDLRLGAGGSSEPSEPPQPTGLSTLKFSLGKDDVDVGLTVV